MQVMVGGTLPTPVIRTQYPEMAIRELLVNAVVHRTYFKVSAWTSSVLHMDKGPNVLFPTPHVQ